MRRATQAPELTFDYFRRICAVSTSIFIPKTAIDTPMIYHEVDCEESESNSEVRLWSSPSDKNQAVPDLSLYLSLNSC
jgi:hypothetical protein